MRSWIEQLDPDVIRGWFSSDEEDLGGYAEERQLDMAQLQKVALGGIVVVALLMLLMMGGNNNNGRTVSATRTVGPAGHQTLDPVRARVAPTTQKVIVMCTPRRRRWRRWAAARARAVAGASGARRPALATTRAMPPSSSR